MGTKAITTAITAAILFATVTACSSGAAEGPTRATPSATTKAVKDTRADAACRAATIKQISEYRPPVDSNGDVDLMQSFPSKPEECIDEATWSRITVEIARAATATKSADAASEPR